MKINNSISVTGKIVGFIMYLSSQVYGLNSYFFV